MRAIALVAAFALTGCMMPVPPAETITLEIHPGLCRYCAGSKLRASSDGRVVYETRTRASGSGEWQSRTQRWRARPEQFAAFRARLAPYRPEGSRVLAGAPACKTYTPDGRSTGVSWRGGGADALLVINSGCDPEAHRVMTDAILSSPALVATDKRPRG